MKYLTQHWPRKYGGILYFFQRLEEMLFHYSSDIVRTPIHNTRTLILEYLYNEDEMKKGRVKGYQVDQILNELRESLKNDKILSENLGREFIEYVAKELTSQRGDIVRYLNNKISKNTYFLWTQKYLLKHCEIESHKDEIEFGTRSWIVEVISRGHSPEYVYKYLQTEMAKVSIDASEKLKTFIEHFSLESKSFRIYFAFAPILSDCKALLEQRLKISFEDDGSFKRFKISKKDFIGCMDIESYDRYTAIDNAFINISAFLKYYRVLSNRRKELVRKFCIVQEIENQNFYKLPIKSLGYRSIEVEPKQNIAIMVDQIIRACQGKSKEIVQQLNKCIELHNQAIRQHDLNDGFVNLWSILEIICEDTLGESKIEKVINGIVPILQKDYFSALHENIARDLRDNLSKDDYIALIDYIGTKNPNIDPIVQFIYLPEFEKLREDYFKNKLQSFPIIMTKIYRLWKLKDNASMVKGLSLKYTQRIKWHIYRLYRARNAIVHSGDTHQRIQMLGEHLHIYIDRILYEILIKLTTERTLRTISDVLIDTKLSLQKTLLTISTDNPITEDILVAMHESYFHNSNK